jgi:hypothetical protein
MVFSHPPRWIEVMPHQIRATAPFDRATKADLLGKLPSNGNGRFSSQRLHPRSYLRIRNTDLEGLGSGAISLPKPSAIAPDPTDFSGARKRRFWASQCGNR